MQVAVTNQRTFVDICEEIDSIINSSDYSDENKGNYRGSLKTRLNSLNFLSGDSSSEVKSLEKEPKFFVKKFGNCL